MASVNKLLEALDQQIRSQLEEYNYQKSKGVPFDLIVESDVKPAQPSKPTPKAVVESKAAKKVLKKTTTRKAVAANAKSDKTPAKS